MIIVFEEDNTVFLADDERSLRARYEDIDVVTGEYQFYDDQGRRYKVIRAGKKLTGWRRFLFGDDYSYRLELSSEAPTRELEERLKDTNLLEPNDYFESIEQLRASLRTNVTPG